MAKCFQLIAVTKRPAGVSIMVCSYKSKIAAKHVHSCHAHFMCIVLELFIVASVYTDNGSAALLFETTDIADGRYSAMRQLLCCGLIC